VKRAFLRALSAVAWLALGGAAWAPIAGADEKAPASAPAPKISVDPSSFDFGKALPEKTLEKQFSIRNFGDADLVIEQVTTTCGCTAALLDEESRTLKPGRSGQLRVRLQTRDYSGKIVRSVMVRSNDPAQKLLEIKVEADVQAKAK
jgi:Protein of unknown function (DUF1573)